MRSIRSHFRAASYVYFWILPVRMYLQLAKTQTDPTLTGSYFERWTIVPTKHEHRLGVFIHVFYAFTYYITKPNESLLMKALNFEVSYDPKS